MLERVCKNSFHRVQIKKKIDNIGRTARGARNVSVTTKKVKLKRMDVKATINLPLWAQRLAR